MFCGSLADFLDLLEGPAFFMTTSIQTSMAYVRHAYLSICGYTKEGMPIALYYSIGQFMKDTPQEDEIKKASKTLEDEIKKRTTANGHSNFNGSFITDNNVVVITPPRKLMKMQSVKT